MANPRTYVEAPPVTPLPYGLLSTAVVLDDLTGTKALGIEYEPAYCGPAYDSLGACQDTPDLGTIEVNVDDTGFAVLSATGFPAGEYRIDWGESDLSWETSAALDGRSYGYAAPGTYTVVVTSENGYRAVIPVTVEDATATGPFTGDPFYARVASEGIDLVDGEPFNLYHLFRCAPLGQGGEARFQERARTALRLGEQRALERVTGSLLAADTDGVDLTPTYGVATPLVEGIALLEGWSAANYGGVPVIHLPRSAGTVLGRRLERVSGHLETIQGSLVASGGGYDRLQGPGGDAAPAAAAGEAWLYVTGQVVIHRGDTEDVGPILDSATGGRLNVWSALVERPYTSTWECITGAVLVDLYGSL